MNVRRWTTALIAAPVLFLFAAQDVLAQQGSSDGSARLHDRATLLHDRATLPPGAPFDGGAVQANASQVALTGAAEAAVTAVARDLGAALAARDFRPGAGLELASRTQLLLHDVLMGEARGKAIAPALEEPENGSARAEARALGQSLEGLLLEPATLPLAVVAFNAFVMASSEEFLTAPPEEFLAVHAALERLTIVAQEAADAATSE